MVLGSSSGYALKSRLRPMKDEVVAKGGVVTANHPQAAEAGMKILREGGNAVDAGVATGFVNNVVAPYSAGIAGQGIMLVHLAGEGKTVAIDFNARSPRAATPEMYKVVGVAKTGINIFTVENDEIRMGPKSVCVPGTPAGLCLAHELYGTLPLGKVMEPAVSLASEGFLVRPYTTARIGGMMARIRSRPLLADMWIPDGRPPIGSAGERIIQRDLGRLLGRISREGSDAFYKGDIADAIVEEVQGGGGVLTKEDLEGYEARALEPLGIDYKGRSIVTVPAPIGGQTTLEMLNILENFDLKSLGHSTVEHLHTFVECARHAFADRYRFLGDWEAAPVPLKGLLSEEYAEEVASQVDTEKAALEPEIDEEPWAYYMDKALHDPWGHDPGPRPSGSSFSAQADGGGTTHFNAVDGEGNMVCCTHFGGFGEGGIPPGSGVYLNGFMGQLIPVAGHPNSVGGWKHPLTNDSPLMVLDGGRPIFCVGAPGGRRIISRITQIAVNVLEFGMGIQKACAAPTVDASTMATVVDSRIPEEVVGGLRAMGHRVDVVEESFLVGHFSRPSGILVDREAGLYRGGVDVFGSAVALGL